MNCSPPRRLLISLVLLLAATSFGGCYSGFSDGDMRSMSADRAIETLAPLADKIDGDGWTNIGVETYVGGGYMYFGGLRAWRYRFEDITEVKHLTGYGWFLCFLMHPLAGTVLVEMKDGEVVKLEPIRIVEAYEEAHGGWGGSSLYLFWMFNPGHAPRVIRDTAVALEFMRRRAAN